MNRHLKIALFSFQYGYFKYVRHRGCFLKHVPFPQTPPLPFLNAKIRADVRFETSLLKVSKKFCILSKQKNRRNTKRISVLEMPQAFKLIDSTFVVVLVFLLCFLFVFIFFWFCNFTEIFNRVLFNNSVAYNFVRYGSHLSSNH